MNATTDLFAIEAETLAALAHPSRLEILDLLRAGEQCVCHMQAVLGQRQAYVSQQLNPLRQTGLIVSRKEGKRVYYRVSDPQVFELIDKVKAFVRSQTRLQIDKPVEAAPFTLKQPCNCPRCLSNAVTNL